MTNAELSPVAVDSSTVTREQLNHLPHRSAVDFFFAICHCHRWASDMAEARPYITFDALQQQAKKAWHVATEAEILEAFQGHARIGDLSALKQKYSAANKEQGQVAQASESVIQALFDDNETYFSQNGFIFIVCATGKSADEMLALLRERLLNPRALEVANGAIEQGKITQIRLNQRVTD